MMCKTAALLGAVLSASWVAIAMAVNSNSTTTPPSGSTSPRLNVTIFGINSTLPGGLNFTLPRGFTVPTMNGGPQGPPMLGNIILSQDQQNLQAVLTNNSAFAVNGLPPKMVLQLMSDILSLPSDVRRIIQNASAYLEQIGRNPSMAAGIPTSVFSALSDTALAQIGRLAGGSPLNPTLLGVYLLPLCTRMWQQLPRDQMNRVAARMFNSTNGSCDSVFMSNRVQPPNSPGQSQDLFNSLVQAKGANFNSWDYNSTVAPNWRLIVSVLSPQDLQGFSSFFPKLIAAGLFNPNDVNDDGMRQQMTNNMLQQAGDPRNWTASTLLQNQNALGQMPPSGLRTIPGTALIGQDLSSMVSSMEPQQQRALGDQVFNAYKGQAGGLAALNATDIRKIVSVIGTDRNVIMELNPAQVISAVGNTKLDPQSAALWGTKLRAAPDFVNPANLTSAKLQSAGDMVAGFGLDFLKRLDPSNAAQAINNVKNAPFDQRAERQVFVSAFLRSNNKNFSALSSSELSSFGPLLVGVPSDQLQQLSKAAITGVVANGSFAATQLSKDSARVVASQLKDSGCPTKESLNNLGINVGSAFEATDFRSCNIDSLGLAGTSTPNYVSNINLPQALELFAKVRTAWGALGGGNYTADKLAVMGNAFTLGVSAADISTMSNNMGDLIDQLELLNDNEGNLTVDQTAAAANALASFYGFNSTASVQNVTSAIIQQIGKLLKHLSIDQLRYLPISVRSAAVQQIGSSNLDTLSLSQQNILLQFALQNVVNNSGALVNRSQVVNLTAADLTSLGNLQCVLSANQLSNLAGDALDQYSTNLAQCCFSPTQMKALLSSISAKRPMMLSNTSSYLLQAGPVLGYLDETQLANIDKIQLSSIAADIADLVQNRRQICAGRRNAGFFDEWTASEQSEDNAAMQRLLSLVANAFTTASSSRRKRATSSLTCNDIKLLGDGTEAISVAQINAMAGSEFLNCLENLGDEPSWSNDQLSALATRANEQLTGAANWTADQITYAGSICLGLPIADFRNLPLSTLAAIASVGRFDKILSSKLDYLTAGYTRYLTLAKSGNAASITTVDLSSLGSFACGATTDQISRIPPTAFYGAASSISTLTTCNTTQLQAYAVLATNASAFGSPSAWNTASYSSIGVVIGGLTDQQMQSIPTDKMSYIPIAALRNIPPARFAIFSNAQLAGLSSQQIQAISADQQSAMSAAQLKQLQQLGGTVRVPIPGDQGLGPGAGAEKMWTSISTSIICVMVAILSL